MQNKFVPLRPQVPFSSAATIEVVCKVTGQRLKWNEAVAAKWCADANGEPFNAYYSPDGMREVALRLTAKPILP